MAVDIVVESFLHSPVLGVDPLFSWCFVRKHDRIHEHRSMIYSITTIVLTITGKYTGFMDHRM